MTDSASMTPAVRNRTRWPVIVVGMSFAAGAAAVFLLLVGTAGGQRLDRKVFQAAKSAQDGISVPDVLRLDIMTDPLMWISVAVVILLIGNAIRQPLIAVATLAVPVVCIVTARTLRLEVLERPQLDQDVPWPTANTFPSGHVAGAMGIALSLLVIAPSWMRLAGVVPCAAWVTLVSRDIMGAGWHRLSDVAGSVLLAAAIVSLFAATFLVGGRRIRGFTLVATLTGGPVATTVIVLALDPRPYGVLTGVLAATVAIPMTVFVCVISQSPSCSPSRRAPDRLLSRLPRPLLRVVAARATTYKVRSIIATKGSATRKKWGDGVDIELRRNGSEQ
ncbi:phosphatase PAP2 family protein [Rhodococcus erythropolis]|uniref:phosphatase PAP2 family protein n=1 Tax=Rhodococcus erythropolis TaxID=1833 RepID=UPI002949C60C|nr:phosphatase PAP2 family protein [Rhodococcus erythropolis]MDV6276546.1 phosphatase PAP2 family protein [Rhodococcus erythropolis]